MSEFIKPKGLNFSCSEEISAQELSKVLSQIVRFLQQTKSHIKLKRYNDWWEHDGLHFSRGSFDFEKLLKIVDSAKSLQESMTGDFYVFIGIAPDDNSWYLRFYLDEDDNLGRFDITLFEELALEFRRKCLGNLNFNLKETASEIYYNSIISQ